MFDVLMLMLADCEYGLMSCLRGVVGLNTLLKVVEKLRVKSKML